MLQYVLYLLPIRFRHAALHPSEGYPLITSEVEETVVWKLAQMVQQFGENVSLI